MSTAFLGTLDRLGETLPPVALQATLLLAAALLVQRLGLGRRGSAAARHLLWTLALGGLVLLPMIGRVVPAWTVPIPGSVAGIELPALRDPDVAATTQASPPAGGERVPAQRPLASPSVVDARGIAPSPDAPVDGTTPAAPTPFTWPRLLVALWLGGAVVLLLRVLAEQWLAHRLARGTVPVRDAAWAAELQAAAGTFGLRRRVRLLRTSAPGLPLTWGLVRPAVLVPAQADDWTPERRRAVLLHELAHVARHDCLAQTVAAVACALYWPHPGVWWAAARLRVERELACDDQAIGGGIAPRAYARHLLEIARAAHPSPRLSAAVVGMATSSQLEQRLRAAVDGRRVRTAPGRRAVAASAAAAALLLLPLAALRDAAAGTPAPSRGLATVARLSAVVAQPEPRPQPLGGRWWIRLATDAEAREQGLGDSLPVVHVMLRTNGLNTFYVPLSRFDGLSPDMLATPGGMGARFRLRRDAGALAFDGTFRGGRGEGDFDFASDTAFAAELRRRGMEAPTEVQLFSLARHGVELAYLDELRAQGYRQPGTAAFVRSGLTGADLRYLRAMGAAGHRFGTLEALIRAYNTGATPDGPPTVVRTAPPARPAPPAPRDEPDASRPQPTSTPTTGRWVIVNRPGGAVEMELFWDDSTNWRRTIDVAELRGLLREMIASSSARDVEFRIDQDGGDFAFTGTFARGRGTGRFTFTPERGFVRTLESLGVADAAGASDHDLKNMAWGSVAADSLRAFHALGLRPRTVDEVTGMAIRMVTPGWVRELRELGVEELDTVEGVTELRFHGVTPAYVRHLATLGHRGLSGREILELRSRR